MKICLESGFRIAPNFQKIEEMTMASQFGEMTSSSNFFVVICFGLSSLVTGPRFMLILSLVLELGQFSFIRN